MTLSFVPRVSGFNLESFHCISSIHCSEAIVLSLSSCREHQRKLAVAESKLSSLQQKQRVSYSPCCVGMEGCLSLTGDTENGAVQHSL